MQNKNTSYMNLDTTHKYALEEFAAKDPEKISLNSAVEYDSSAQTFNVFFLQNNYTVKHPTGKILTTTGEKAPLYFSIILLHYLNTADGTPLAGKWVSFKELPGGQIYIEPFRKRAITPLVKVFGESPQKFMDAASRAGGFANPQLGKNCMVIPVLPRVPVAFIIHPGDEEFEATANILFDANATFYLPTEDYAHLPAIMVKTLQSLA